MRPTPGLPLRTCDRTFAAVPGQVRHARRFLAAAVSDPRLADDALTCLSELATNAVIHSDSRIPGGIFRVRVSSNPELIRVEITDAGGQWPHASTPSEDQRGRGLAIIAALATSWAITAHVSGRTAWCELVRHAPRGVDGLPADRMRHRADTQEIEPPDTPCGLIFAQYRDLLAARHWFGWLDNAECLRRAYIGQDPAGRDGAKEEGDHHHERQHASPPAASHRRANHRPAQA